MLKVTFDSSPRSGSPRTRVGIARGRRRGFIALTVALAVLMGVGASTATAARRGSDRAPAEDWHPLASERKAYGESVFRAAASGTLSRSQLAKERDELSRKYSEVVKTEERRVFGNQPAPAPSRERHEALMRSYGMSAQANGAPPAGGAAAGASALAPLGASTRSAPPPPDALDGSAIPTLLSFPGPRRAPAALAAPSPSR